jgi:transcriptional regulator with XRE-family HTH domain
MTKRKASFYYKRKELGLTQKQVADACSVSQSAISLAENFDYRYADPALINVMLKLIEGGNYEYN